MSSVEEVRAALAAAGEQVRTAQYRLGQADETLADAETGLLAAGRDHPRSLVPPHLPRARDGLGELIDRVAALESVLTEYTQRL